MIPAAVILSENVCRHGLNLNFPMLDGFTNPGNEQSSISCYVASVSCVSLITSESCLRATDNVVKETSGG